MCPSLNYLWSLSILNMSVINVSWDKNSSLHYAYSTYISIIQGIDIYIQHHWREFLPSYFQLLYLPRMFMVSRRLIDHTGRLEVGPEIKKKWLMHVHVFKINNIFFFCSHQFHHWHVNFLKVRFIYFYMYHQVFFFKF